MGFSFDAETASPPSHNIRRSFEEDTLRSLERFSSIERSILSAKKTGQISSSPLFL
ncbi:Protein of unknown function [Pyronema omphalodes CBS 100304]|uniref:Uncharacterized protein n=1 Tax=Pyronema omphalodes (strain CBS 100304) TaxID=1076935 RepID=U4L1F4_PYROM|nr:Protein of unknown function [Pyronema omphalodes CBS 100304]